MDIQTACYYTFSTISQTLAGSFGFLVAVVLYQLQAIVSRIPDEELHARQHRVYDEHAHYNAAVREDWEKVLELLENAPFKGVPENSPSRELIEFRTSQFGKDVRALKSIRRGLERSLNATGITIGISLVLLVLTPAIAQLAWLAFVCLVVDVAFAVYCLLSYYPLVRSVVE